MKDDRHVGDGAAERLAQAIDRVQHDVEMVAFWACAFGGLVRPIPDYQIKGVTVLTTARPALMEADRAGDSSRISQLRRTGLHSGTPQPAGHTRIGIRT
jgi:hypothetical protein